MQQLEDLPLHCCYSSIQGEFLLVRTARSNQIHILKNLMKDLQEIQNISEENHFPKHIQDISSITPVQSTFFASKITVTCLESHYFLIQKPMVKQLIERQIKHNYKMLQKKQKIGVYLFGNPLFFQITQTYLQDFSTNHPLKIDHNTIIDINLSSTLNFRFRQHKLLKTYMKQNDYLLKKARQFEIFCKQDHELMNYQMVLLFDSQDPLFENLFLWLTKKQLKKPLIKIDLSQCRQDIYSSQTFFQNLTELLKRQSYIILLDSIQEIDLEDELVPIIRTFLQENKKNQTFVFKIYKDKKREATYQIIDKYAYEIKIQVCKELFTSFLELTLGQQRISELEKIQRYVNVRNFGQMLEIQRGLNTC